MYPLKAFGVIEEVLILAPMILGAWYAFRVLRFPDLSIESTFVLGAVVSTLWNRHVDGGWLILFSIPLSVIGCATTTAIWGTVLFWKLRASKIVASIIAAFSLYSINLALLGRPNLSLKESQSVFQLITINQTSVLQRHSLILVVSGALFTLAAIALRLWMTSAAGITISGAGCNPRGIQVLGGNARPWVVAGLSFEGALIGLSGCLYSQREQYTDVNMGVGLLIVALAAICLALFLSRRPGLNVPIVSLCVGLLVFKFITALSLEVGVPPVLNKLSNGITLIILIFVLRRWKPPKEGEGVLFD